MEVHSLCYFESNLYLSFSLSFFGFFFFSSIRQHSSAVWRHLLPWDTYQKRQATILRETEQYQTFDDSYLFCFDFSDEFDSIRRMDVVNFFFDLWRIIADRDMDREGKI